MGLIVKRAGADEYGRSLKALIAGDPGAGKTRISSTFPNPFYANVEGGLMSVADRQVPYTDITSSEDLNALLQVLRQTPKARENVLKVPVSTVIIDTLDAVQKLLIDERKRNEKKESMAIADWGWLGDQLRMIVRNYRNLDLNVIFTCHLKTVEDSESGQTFVKPALQGAMGDEIAAYVDIAGLLKASPKSVVKDGKAVRTLQRLLQTGPDARHPWLKDRSGKLEIELEMNLTDDGVRLLKYIYGGSPVAPSVAVEDVAPVPDPPKEAAPVATAETVTPPDLPVDVVKPTAEPVRPEVVAPPEQTLTPEPTPDSSAPPALELVPEQVPEQQVSNSTLNADMVCSDCGDPIESEDQRDLSQIRFRRALDKKCFTLAKQNKK